MSEHTHRDGRLRRSMSRLTRLGDVPVVFMLAWAGWLAVPWSFGGLAQARAAAAAAAAQAEPPALLSVRQAAPASPWGISPQPAQPITVRSPRDPQAQVAEDAVAMERARIAGEVHDAAGHGLAAIAMQAGLALVALDDDPDQVRASLQAIRETSTRALGELRAALDSLDPRPDLMGLIQGVRAAGLPVDVEPAQPTTPAHLSGTVYRVVRESLTNVLRHAGPTRALVRVTNDPCEFVLEVADRGRGWTGAAEGRGLAGIRARVADQGGQLWAGPREGGGFQVVARFPTTRA
ncbi:sensor histidine kinase [Nonomuraea sp. NPDC050536]|uniref:sensor histidine kinase n=1 Tax=Nonomuraea sp. NPDC050536 TaxID=3364366 RepID=UPI0037C514A9